MTNRSQRLGNDRMSLRRRSGGAQRRAPKAEKVGGVVLGGMGRALGGSQGVEKSTFRGGGGVRTPVSEDTRGPPGGLSELLLEHVRALWCPFLTPKRACGSAHSGSISKPPRRRWGSPDTLAAVQDVPWVFPEVLCDCQARQEAPHRMCGPSSAGRPWLCVRKKVNKSPVYPHLKRPLASF